MAPSSGTLSRIVFVVLVSVGGGLFRTAFTISSIVNLAPCALLSHHCQCTPDLQEFVCRAAGFRQIPQDTLPYAIRRLDLTSNNITALNETSLLRYNHLEELILRNNLITLISSTAFHQNRKLVVLLLKRNHIADIPDDAFTGLQNLKVLELDDNLLTEIPIAVTRMPRLQELSLSNNKIRSVPAGLLKQVPELSILELKGNYIAKIHNDAFVFLPHLRTLVLSECRQLTSVPNFNGSTQLEKLRLDRTGLQTVPSSLCVICPKLKLLDLKSNQLSSVPDLSKCREIRILDLSNNYIRSLNDSPFAGMHQMHDLLLAHNVIQHIPQNAFKNLSKLQLLDLEDNQISFIHPDAFLPVSRIDDLNLGQNVFVHLPTAGLERLLHLKTFNNPNLREFPPPEDFPRIQTLVLAYAYHCCAFLPLIPLNPPPRAKDIVVFPDIDDIDLNMWNSSSIDLWPSQQNISHKLGKKFETIWEKLGSDITYPANFPSYLEEEYSEDDSTIRMNSFYHSNKIQCLPAPGPFLPCQDLFDWWTLRCGVWIVFLCAMLGNGTVVFVLIFSRGKMDVPRFLVCNLAAADFFMGVYLGFLAVVDASTLGEFRMYAIPWQMSVGCQLSGFLGVLSSELSVYTLAVITLERNYAITHAMHLNKRLSLKHAGYIMLCGWSFAIVMAALPLFQISDYRKFATCLPFETSDTASLTYVVFLMLINGIAFLILMGCYLKMYCAIRGSQAWNSNDSRIAKRMALLVFTDFLCWSPIAFFTLTAICGLELISLEQAKVFTVFILPLNSCCNPFLYAILTKQFKKDCVLICKAIEESRVTRGIGRCRHSSNFSNRQTPANTNSLADRSSRDNQPLNHSGGLTPQSKCTCNMKLLSEENTPNYGQISPQVPTSPAVHWWDWLFFCNNYWSENKGKSTHGSNIGRKKPKKHHYSDQYAYQIAEIQQKQHKRTSSVSSSDNYSSSRSDSWRHHHHLHCGIPLRLLDPKRRGNSRLVTRKPSQDSSLSSSRNDSSSGSATTASTGTWRVSRSSGGSETQPRCGSSSSSCAGSLYRKPRLTRQQAVQQEEFSDPGSPTSRLTVRFLTTIPSCAEASMQIEEHPSNSNSSNSMNKMSTSGQLCAILHAQVQIPIRRQSIVTLHPIESVNSSDTGNISDENNEYTSQIDKKQ